MALEIACAFADVDEVFRHVQRHTRFMGNDFGFDFVVRVVEVKRAETLFGRLLQILHQALVAGVVGNDNLEIRVRFDHLALFFQRQLAAGVGQRVDHHGRVLTRFDHFIEVADCPMARGNGKRAILPAGAVGVQQETADQIGSRHVFVTRHGDERLAQFPGHVFDKTRLAAAGRALQHHRHPHGVGRFVQLDFVGHCTVIRLFLDTIGIKQGAAGL